MATQVRLFVSAGPAEEGAREHLGRALAELPINVGWVIKRTPDIDSVAECHLFALLLGHDIVAPVGLELWWARRTEKPILAYTPGGLRTPACQVFYQDNLYLDWRTFPDLVALRRAYSARRQPISPLARRTLRRHHARGRGLARVHGPIGEAGDGCPRPRGRRGKVRSRRHRAPGAVA